MSRSYRKSRCFVQGCGSNKRIANKRVRKYKDLGNHSYYKRVYESYDIRDIVWHEPPEAAIDHKKYLEAARIIRKIYKGELNALDYDLKQLKKDLDNGSYTFWYYNKK